MTSSLLAVLLLLLLPLPPLAEAQSPAGFACRQAWKTALAEGAADDGAARNYHFRLAQSVEARWLGASERISAPDLLRLTSRDVVGAYAIVTGNITLRRICNVTGGESATFRANLMDVRVVCDDSIEHHKECLSKFAPLELSSPTFWYEQSQRSGAILRTSVPSTDPELVANFKESLIKSFGLTEGNCSVRRDGHELNVVEHLVGRHGRERPLQFHSMRVHDMVFAASTLSSASSRAVYALDVHGKTRSGRAAPHHFVHSSIDLGLVGIKYIKPEGHNIEKCSPASAAAYDDDADEVTTITPMLPTALMETFAASQTSVGATARSKFSPRDVANFVGDVASTAQQVRETVKKGKEVLKSLAIDLQRLVNTLLAPVPQSPMSVCAKEALAEARKAVQFDSSASIDPVRAKRLLCKCNPGKNDLYQRMAALKFRSKDTCSQSPAGADVNIADAKTAVPQVGCHWIRQRCVPEDEGENRVESSEEIMEQQAPMGGVISQGIRKVKSLMDTFDERYMNTVRKVITTLENDLNSVNLEAKGVGAVESVRKHIGDLAEELRKSVLDSVEAELNSIIDFIINKVVNVLREIKQLVPTITKTLRPITTLLQKFVRMLSPMMKAAQTKATELDKTGDPSATFEAEGSAAVLLSSIPKSITKQWTNSAEYEALFGAKGGNKGVVNELIGLMDGTPGAESRKIGLLLISRAGSEAVKCSGPLSKAAPGSGFEAYLTCWLSVMVGEASESIENTLKVQLEEKKKGIMDALGEFMFLIEAKAIPAGENDAKKAASAAALKAKELVSKGLEAAKNIEKFMQQTKGELESVLEKVESKRDEVFSRVNQNIIKLRSIIDMKAVTFEDLLIAGAAKLNRENGKLSLEHIWSISIFGTIDNLERRMERFVSVFSAGRSFSKRTEYAKGLMQGWVATGYAEAGAQLTAIPDLSAKGRAAIGIDYHGTKQQRRGNLLELSLSPSVTVEDVEAVAQGIKDDVMQGREEWSAPTPKFDPPVGSLVPMLSVMGSPPIPMSGDPIKILESVFPHVQKRIMSGLADTSMWFPIVATFVREHLLQVPSIRKALGGVSDSLSEDENIYNSDDSLEHDELTVARIEHKMRATRNAICSRAEKMLAGAEESSREAVGRMAQQAKAKAVEVSKAMDETRIGNAFQGPFRMVKTAIMAVDMMAPQLEKLLLVVKEKIEEPAFSDVKQVMCHVQDKFFSGALKACNLVETIMDVVGKEADTLATLLGQSADEIDCGKDAATKYAQNVQNMRDMLLNKTQTGSMFAVCRLAKSGGIIDTCHDNKPASEIGESFVEMSEQGDFFPSNKQPFEKAGFIQDILGFANILKSLESEAIELGEGTAKAKEDVRRLMRNMLNSINGEVDNSVSIMNNVASDTQTLFEGSIHSAKDLATDAQTSFEGGIGSVEKVAANVKNKVNGGVGSGVDFVSSVKTKIAGSIKDATKTTAGLTILENQQARVSFLEKYLKRRSKSVIQKQPSSQSRPKKPPSKMELARVVLEEKKKTADEEHVLAKAAVQKAVKAVTDASKEDLTRAKEMLKEAEKAEAEAEVKANTYLKELYDTWNKSVRKNSALLAEAIAQKNKAWSVAVGARGDDSGQEQRDSAIDKAEKTVLKLRKKLNFVTKQWQFTYRELRTNYEDSMQWKGTRLEEAMKIADAFAVQNAQTALEAFGVEYFQLLSTAKEVKESIYMQTIEQRDEAIAMLRDYREAMARSKDDGGTLKMQVSKFEKAAEEAGRTCDDALMAFNTVAKNMKEVAKNSIASADARLKQAQSVIEEAQRKLKAAKRDAKAVAEHAVEAAFATAKGFSDALERAERKAFEVIKDIKQVRDKAVDYAEARLGQAKVLVDKASLAYANAAGDAKKVLKHAQESAEKAYDDALGVAEFTGQMLQATFKDMQNVASQAARRADERWAQAKAIVAEAERAFEEAGDDAKSIYLNAKIAAQTALKDATAVVGHFEDKLSETMDAAKGLLTSAADKAQERLRQGKALLRKAEKDLANFAGGIKSEYEQAVKNADAILRKAQDAAANADKVLTDTINEAKRIKNDILRRAEARFDEAKRVAEQAGKALEGIGKDLQGAARKAQDEANAAMQDCRGVVDNAKEKFADFQKEVEGVANRLSEQATRIKQEAKSASKAVAAEAEATAEEIWLQIGKALMMVRTELKESPLVALLRAGGQCTSILTESSNLVTELVDDFHEVLGDTKHSVMQFGSADPERMLTMMASNFKKVASKCDKHLSHLSLIDDQFESCIVAIEGVDTTRAREKRENNGSQNTTLIEMGSTIKASLRRNERQGLRRYVSAGATQQVVRSSQAFSDANDRAAEMIVETEAAAKSAVEKVSKRVDATNQAIKKGLEEAAAQIEQASVEAERVAKASEAFIVKARADAERVTNATVHAIDTASEAAKKVTYAMESGVDQLNDAVKGKLDSVSNAIDTAGEFAREKTAAADDLISSATVEAKRVTELARSSVVKARETAKEAANTASTAVAEADSLVKHALNDASIGVASARAKMKEAKKKADETMASGAAAAKQLNDKAMNAIDEASVSAKHAMDLAQAEVEKADAKVKAALDRAAATVAAANEASKQVLVATAHAINQGKVMADYMMASVDKAVQQASEAASTMLSEADDKVSQVDELATTGIKVASDAVKEAVKRSKELKKDTESMIADVRVKTKEATEAANTAVIQAAAQGKQLTEAAARAVDEAADACSNAIQSTQKMAHEVGMKVRDAAKQAVQRVDRALDWARGAQNKVATQAKSVAIRMIRTTRTIIPALRKPLSKVRDVSIYVDKSLTCISGMIPPVKQSVALVKELFERGSMMKVSTLEKVQTRLTELFDVPLRCAGPDVVDPLVNLFKSNVDSNALEDAVEDNYPEEVARSRKLAEQSQNIAKSITHAIPMVQNLISSSLRVYGQIQDLISIVAKYAASLHDGSRTGGFSQAAGVIRDFKNGVTEIVLALRDLRELLEMLPIDEDTVLLVFETAEKTLVGLEAGCDAIIEMMMSNTLPVSSDSGISKATLLFQLSAHKKAGKERTRRTITQPDRVMLQKLEEKIATLENAQAEARAETVKKLDNLQMSADNIAIGVRQGNRAAGGGGAHKSSSSDDYTETALRRESKQFQKRVMSEQRRMSCPLTHEVVGEPEQIQIGEKSIDMLIETIQVPTSLTYGIDVRVGIMLRAVAGLYINHVTCSCACTQEMSAPCSEILKVGPSLQLHILGTGTASVGVKILAIRGTINLQVGSLYLNSELNLGRVALQKAKPQDPPAIKNRQLCVKDLPADETTFGIALKTTLEADVLKGEFKLGVDVLGLKTFSLAAYWPSVHARLGSWCLEPPRWEGGEDANNDSTFAQKSKKKKNLSFRRLEPASCPARSDVGSVGEPHTVKASERPAGIDLQESCSVCQMKETSEGGFDCKHPPSRILAMAGYTDLPDVAGLGNHFQSLLEARRKDLMQRVTGNAFQKGGSSSINGMEYFTEKQRSLLLEDVTWMSFTTGAYSTLPVAPRLDRLFTSSKAAATDSYGSDLTDDVSVPNHYKYMSSIFVCSEDLQFKKKTKDVDAHSVLEYTGNIYITYSLDSSFLRRRASGEKRIDAFLEEKFKVENDEAFVRYEGVEDRVSRMASFEARFKARKKATDEVTRPFVLPFTFHIDIPQKSEFTSDELKSKRRQKHVPGQRKEWMQYTKETENSWGDKPKPNCFVESSDGKMVRPKAGCINTWVDASNGVAPEGSIVSFTMMHRASLSQAVASEIRKQLDCDYDFKPRLSDKERGLAFVEVENGAISAYDANPKKGEPSQWTKSRCEACCDDFGASNGKHRYDSEISDSKIRSCKTGKVKSSFRPSLLFGGKVQDSICKEKCCGAGRKICKEDDHAPTAKSKSKRSKTSTKGILRDVSSRAGAAVRAAFGPNKGTRREAGKSEQAKAIVNIRDSVQLARMNALSGIEQNTIDAYILKYRIPDHIAEWITIDAAVPGTRTASERAILSLPPSENVFQVSIDAFGTPTPGSMRDSCSRSWLFYKALLGQDTEPDGVDDDESDMASTASPINRTLNQGSFNYNLSTLRAAADGQSKSQGGLNLQEIEQLLELNGFTKEDLVPFKGAQIRELLRERLPVQSVSDDVVNNEQSNSENDDYSKNAVDVDPNTPLMPRDLFRRNKPQKLLKKEVCHRVLDLANQKALKTVDWGSTGGRPETWPRYVANSGDSYEGFRAKAIQSLDLEPCDIEGNTHSSQKGFRTQMCFACEFSGNTAYDGNKMGNEAKKSFRWRCALSGRRGTLPTAMSSLSADEFGKMHELRGCPAKETQSDKKYSEADYFRTLMYSQGDRIAASLKTFFGVPSPEDITDITVCGEDIRWDYLSAKEDDDVGLSSTSGKDLVDLDRLLSVRPLGALCNPKSDATRGGLLASSGSITTCRHGVEYMPDLKCDDRTRRCVYKDPTSDKCSLDPNSADSMACDVERGKSDRSLNDLVRGRFDRKCDPAKNSRAKNCDESISLKCVRNLCKKIPDGKFKPPGDNEEHGICRKNADCPSRFTGDRKKPGKGKCVFETDCSRISLRNGPRCKINVHDFVAGEKKVKLGLCLHSDSSKLLLNRETCIDDQECVRFAGHKKVQGKCDQHTQKCVMPNSVKTCGPLCNTAREFFDMINENKALYCVNEAEMYSRCDQCLKDTDCIQFKRALDDPELATTTAKCEYPFFERRKGELEGDYESRIRHIGGAPGYKVCVEKSFPGVPGKWTDARCEQCCGPADVSARPETYEESDGSKRDCSSGKRPKLYSRASDCRNIPRCTMASHNELIRLISNPNKTLAKSRCEISDAQGRVANSEKFEWIYSGIAYVNVASAEKMVELGLASLPENPLVREMAFSLRFNLNNIASADFLDTGVPAKQNDNTFIEPLVTACENLHQSQSYGTQAPEVHPFSKQALQHLCKSQAAYRQVYLEHSAALQNERVSRDPCRIDPDIEPHSYTDPVESKYYFHGWQIGPATIDDDRAVRTNKQCYLCEAQGAQRYGMDDKGKSSLGKVAEKIKSGWRNIGTERFRSLRCQIDHAGSNTKKDKASKRLAALDLFDENDLKNERAVQTLDAVVQHVLMHMGKEDSDADSGNGGEFWAQIYQDQLKQMSRDQWNHETYKTQVAVCDEVGMDNIEVRKPSTHEPYAMTTERIIKTKPGSRDQDAFRGELYGGTLCARHGVRSQCVQYAIPFAKAQEAQAEIEEDPSAKIDEQQTILSKYTVIYRGEDAMPAKKSSDSDPKVQSDGHAYFFNLFISSLMENTRDDQSDRLGNCPRKEELQEVEEVPKEDCQAGRETVCNRILELDDFIRQAGAPNIKEGAQCAADPLDGGSRGMVYAQRFVDPETCEDLLRYDGETFKQWSEESRNGYRGSFDASFGGSTMTAKERDRLRKKKQRSSERPRLRGEDTAASN